MICLLFEGIEDIYEETHIESIYIPKVYYSKKDDFKECSYQNLDKILSLGNIEFFTVTVLIGKVIVKERKEYPDSGEQYIKYSANKTKDEITILKAVAVDEAKNIYILKDYEAMRKIWHDYSITGFEKLYEWYSDKDMDFQTKISEVLLDIFDDNTKMDND